MLFVPKLEYNLLSISKLTKDLNCITKFSPTMCEFQVLNLGRMIGNEICASLYLLRVNIPKRQTQNVSYVVSNSSRNKDDAMMLWHYRLRHPNFLYLKKMLPFLFNREPRNFQCEVCQLSKHIQHSYPHQLYKSSHPFYLIHSDVWGPYSISNISGSRWFVTFIDYHTRITWLFLMKDKSEVGQIFLNFNKLVQTQF